MLPHVQTRPSRPPASGKTPARCLGGLVLLAALLQAPAALAQSEYDRLIFDAVPLLDGVDPAPPGPAGLSAETMPDNDATAAEEVRNLQQLERAIDQAIADEGLFSPLLRERYLDLAASQQRSGQHADALKTLEAAMHITRVNEGLFTPTQISDLEHMLESARAIGDTAREAELRAYLYYVQTRAFEPGDPRLAAARTEWANWNFLNFRQSTSARPFSVLLSGSSSEEELIVVRDSRTGDARFISRRHLMTVGTASMASALYGSPYAMPAEMVLDSRLQTARDIYREAFDTRMEEGPGLELDQAIRQWSAAEYALKWQMDRMLGSNEVVSNTVSRRPNAYRDINLVQRGYRAARDGWQAYTKLLAATPGVDTEVLAQAWIDFAEFQLVYGEESAALAAWNEAWEVLRKAGHDEAAIQARLNPGTPRPLPGFVMHPHERALFGYGPDDILDYQGYIDVSMEVTRDGSPRRVDIFNASEGTPQRIRTKLLDHLRAQVYRPTVGPGELSAKAATRTRYYYRY